MGLLGHMVVLLLRNLRTVLRSGYGEHVYKFTFLATVQGRRQWQPTPVLLPGESHGHGSLVGCSPWGRTESDTTEVT